MQSLKASGTNPRTYEKKMATCGLHAVIEEPWHAVAWASVLQPKKRGESPSHVPCRHQSGDRKRAMSRRNNRAHSAEVEPGGGDKSRGANLGRTLSLAWDRLWLLIRLEHLHITHATAQAELRTPDQSRSDA